MWFIAITIDLVSSEHGARLVLPDAEYAHAAILRSISSIDAGLGQAIHDAKRHKPLSIAFVESFQGHALLRVSFMGQQGLTAADALMTSLIGVHTLQLGRSLWRIRDICQSGTQWTGISTWADLIAGNVAPAIGFHFVTPTAFTKRDSEGNRVMGLFPDPVTLFSGLAQRWKSLDGPALHSNVDSFLLDRGCIESSINICTETWRLSKCMQKGFVGCVTYECRGRDRNCWGALQQLARLATYTGVGYHTAQGMGAVRTIVGNQNEA